MKDYDELLDGGWENSPEEFLLWVEGICGVDKESNTYAILAETVTTQEDIILWINFFDGDIDNVAGTTEAYLEWFTTTEVKGVETAL